MSESSKTRTGKGLYTPPTFDWWPWAVAAIVIAILYVTGWSVAWDESIRSRQDLIIGDAGIMFRLDGGYYGLMITDRFFDSVFISYAAFVPVIWLTGMNLWGIFDLYEEDE